MAFISNGMCHYITNVGIHSIPDIPVHQVQLIRNTSMGVVCFVTSTHLYVVHGDPMTIRKIELLDSGLTDISTTGVSRRLVSYCYLDDQSRVVSDNPRTNSVVDRRSIKTVWKNIVCMCSVGHVTLMLKISGKIVSVLGGKRVVLQLTHNIDLTWGISNMSYYSDPDGKHWLLSLWGERRIVKLRVNSLVNECVDYSEIEPRFTPLYVQGGCVEGLVFTDDGDVVTPHGTYPGYVSVVRDVIPFQLAWYGVRSDGSYDVINTTSIRPGTEPYNITMTNTDKVHTHHVAVKSAMS